MSEIKQERNDKILAYFKAGKTIYWIAKRFKISWPRTQRIIKEHQAREETSF
jgi:hypothetical protein